MPVDTIVVSRILPATPAQIFTAWLDAAEHAAMTGSPATVESAEVGGRFTAWDGYIDGSHLALDPGVRIVQSWRSDDFPADALDSLLEVSLEPAPGGTRVTLRHGDLPEGQGPAVLEGWEEFYLTPMERYFRRAGRKGAKGAGRGAKGGKKAGKPSARAGGKAALAKAGARDRPAVRKAASRKAVRKPVRKPARKAAGRQAAKGAKRRGAAKRGAGKPARKAASRRPVKQKGARR